jgi:hypothetical protein
VSGGEKKIHSELLFCSFVVDYFEGKTGIVFGIVLVLGESNFY